MSRHPIIGDALKLLGLLLIAVGLSAYIISYIPSPNSNPTYTPRNLPPTETTVTKAKTLEVTRTVSNQESTSAGAPEATVTVYKYKSTVTTVTTNIPCITYSPVPLHSTPFNNSRNYIVMSLMKYSNQIYTIDFASHRITLNGSCSSGGVIDEFPESCNPPIWIGSATVHGVGQVYVLMQEPGMAEVYVNNTAYKAFSQILCNPNPTSTPVPYGNTSIPISMLVNNTWTLRIKDVSIPLIFNWTPEPSNISFKISYLDLQEIINSNTYSYKAFYGGTEDNCVFIIVDSNGNYLELNIYIGGIPVAFYDVELNITSPIGTTYYPENYDILGYVNWVELPKDVVKPGLTINIYITDIKLDLRILVTQ